MLLPSYFICMFNSEVQGHCLISPDQSGLCLLTFSNKHVNIKKGLCLPVNLTQVPLLLILWTLLSRRLFGMPGDLYYCISYIPYLAVHCPSLHFQYWWLVLISYPGVYECLFLTALYVFSSELAPMALLTSIKVWLPEPVLKVTPEVK